MAHAYIVALNDATEDSEGCLRLVKRYEMAGVENAREGQVTILSDVTTDICIVDDDVGVAGSRKESVVARDKTGELKRGILPTVPVADYVRIAINEGHSHAACEHFGK